MKSWYFHTLNIIVLVFISAFGLLALFGNAMSEVSSPGVNFAVYTSFLWWGIFYVIQFLKQTNTWKVIWFFTGLVVLLYWISGGGSSFFTFFFA